MVTNLINEKGNAARNQFVIFDENGVTFKSYRTTIARIANGVVSLNRTMWHYSNTTSKYLYTFLRQNGWDINSKKDVQKMIDEGIFQTF